MAWRVKSVVGIPGDERISLFVPFQVAFVGIRALTGAPAAVLFSCRFAGQLAPKRSMTQPQCTDACAPLWVGSLLTDFVAAVLAGCAAQNPIVISISGFTSGFLVS